MISSDTNFAVQAQNLNVYYGNFRAVKDVNLSIERKKVTAIIGPSGCGKSTVLRSFNRMNELVPSARSEGQVFVMGQNIDDRQGDPVEVRRRIGMVFQKPNPFTKSIYENVAWGARLNGFKDGIGKPSMDEWVEHCLRKAALWDEVKDKLTQSGLSLSGGQQQRLCIARTLAVSPEVILMDEPASALDPIATLKIEELMRELAEEYTIIVVTHNMQQAARVSDFTAFFSMDEQRAGFLVEYGPTTQIFTVPQNKQVNEKRYSIESNCITLIATQQPMARDVRFLEAILEIITELERIGDYAQGLSKINQLLSEEPVDLVILNELQQMARLGLDMLRRALDAFVVSDEKTARDIPKEDDLVDQLYNQIYTKLVGQMTA